MVNKHSIKKQNMTRPVGYLEGGVYFTARVIKFSLRSRPDCLKIQNNLKHGCVVCPPGDWEYSAETHQHNSEHCS